MGIKDGEFKEEVTENVSRVMNEIGSTDERIRNIIYDNIYGAKLSGVLDGAAWQRKRDADLNKGATKIFLIGVASIGLLVWKSFETLSKK